MGHPSVAVRRRRGSGLKPIDSARLIQGLEGHSSLRKTGFYRAKPQKIFLILAIAQFRERLGVARNRDCEKIGL